MGIFRTPAPISLNTFEHLHPSLQTPYFWGSKYGLDRSNRPRAFSLSKVRKERSQCSTYCHTSFDNKTQNFAKWILCLRSKLVAICKVKTTYIHCWARNVLAKQQPSRILKRMKVGNFRKDKRPKHCTKYNDSRFSIWSIGCRYSQSLYWNEIPLPLVWRVRVLLVLMLE